MPEQPRQPLQCMWLLLPPACSSVGGGLIKFGGGSTMAAVTVAAGPWVIYGLLYLIFILGYLAALARYLCAGGDGRQAMERLIVISANAVVSILTLTPAAMPRPAVSAPERSTSDSADTAGRVISNRRPGSRRVHEMKRRAVSAGGGCPRYGIAGTADGRAGESSMDR